MQVNKCLQATDLRTQQRGLRVEHVDGRTATQFVFFLFDAERLDRMFDRLRGRTQLLPCGSVSRPGRDHLKPDRLFEGNALLL